MISGITIVTLNGRELCNYSYREENYSDAVSDFVDHVIKRREGDVAEPFYRSNGVTVAFRKCGEVYLIASTSWNANAVVMLEILRAIHEALEHFLGGKIKAAKLQSEMPTVRSVLEETVDYGYPQISDPKTLSYFVFGGEQNKTIEQWLERKRSGVSETSITTEVTGSVSWRRRGIVYKVNEVWLDVNETIDALMSPSGELLSGSVIGTISMNTHLSGMPDCRIVVNDKRSVQKHNTNLQRLSTGMSSAQQAVQQQASRAQRLIDLEGYSFHQSVKLHEFEAKGEISFTPPDGKFTLMQYRISEGITVPYFVTIEIKNQGRTRLELYVSIRGQYSKTLISPKVKLFIPLPPTMSKCVAKADGGTTQVLNEERKLKWKVKEFVGETEFKLSADITMLSAVNDKPWEKPPVKVEFMLPEFVASGLKIKQLAVHEKTLNYTTRKWVRYYGEAGSYECRFPQ
eukprot:TRINITY_DN3536_c0_g1_i3.p1 TRINITY_DN3536_c0_g1~~TRINITY_DN3536_c0_g1_i3.p1  ORF type:complete len:458 (-),score=67.20 TRINITY_DN3536_c0_g1_i3:311-1684(-)